MSIHLSLRGLLLLLLLLGGAKGANWGPCKAPVCQEVLRQTEGLQRTHQMRNRVLTTLEVMSSLLAALDEEIAVTSRDIRDFIGHQCPEVLQLLGHRDELSHESDLGQTTVPQGTLEVSSSPQGTPGHSTVPQGTPGHTVVQGTSDYVPPEFPGHLGQGTLEHSTVSQGTSEQTVSQGYPGHVTQVTSRQVIQGTPGYVAPGYPGHVSQGTSGHSTVSQGTSKQSITQGTPGHVTQVTPGHVTQVTPGHVTQGTPGHVPLTFNQDDTKTAGTQKSNQCHGVPREDPHWVPGLDDWCRINCQAGFCPITKCRC